MIADRADRPDTAVAHARQGLEIAERIGRALSVVFARAALGAALLASGDSSEAVPLLEAATALARERRVGLDYEARFLAWLADAYLAAGDPARARATATEATEIGRQRGTRLFECYAQLALARALRVTDGASARPAIEAAFARAQALIDETGGRSLQPFLHIERAELLALCGDAAARQRELREAQRLFTAMGATARAERVAKELGA
jgi:tetratricopeptide (TPR) repeat protein